MADLTLYAESTWVSPWVFHVMVALEEKRLPYKLELVPLPIAGDVPDRASRARRVLGKVPDPRPRRLLAHRVARDHGVPRRDVPAAGAPAALAGRPRERARARQVMSWLRTSLFGLREDRPTSIGVRAPGHEADVARRPRPTPTSWCGIASALIQPGRTTLFDEWCIADADLALMLMRLVANGDPVPGTRRRLRDRAVGAPQRPEVPVARPDAAVT